MSRCNDYNGEYEDNVDQRASYLQVVDLVESKGKQERGEMNECEGGVFVLQLFL